MTEIVLSFFAVIGVALLIIHFLDYLFYRNFRAGGQVIVDLRGKSEEEIIEILELFSTVRGRKSGAAAIAQLILFIDRNSPMSREYIYHHLNVFALPGFVYEMSPDFQFDPTKFQ